MNNITKIAKLISEDINDMHLIIRESRSDVTGDPITKMIIFYLSIAELDLYYMNSGGQVNMKKFAGLWEDFIEDSIEALGLESIGELGQQANFSRDLHTSDEPLEDNQIVYIHSRGWKRGNEIIKKPYVSSRPMKR